MARKNPTVALADDLFPIQKTFEEVEILDIPPEQRKLHTETYDFTISTLYDNLATERIYIPSFQRGYVWNRSQASRLIESLIIQCPIPTIYLNQDLDERLSVIDGNQRLNSIKLYLEDGFKLQGLSTYPELEGFIFSDLDPRIQRHIQNRTLRCISILKDTHPQIKFEIFERLNTGSVQLNDQELRHGIYFGPFLTLLDELVADPLWRKTTGLNADRRMRSNEIVLRFFALYEKQNEYKKPLRTFLNEFCEKNKKLEKTKIENLKKLFFTALERVDAYLGEFAFRSVDENGKVGGNFNAALFDAQMIAFSNFSFDKKKVNHRQVKARLIQLFKETKFHDSIISGTSAPTSVKYRIKRFSDFLKDA